MNYYELLGIHQDASLEEIRSAFKIKARQWHPDTSPDKSGEMFKKIVSAHKVLSNPDSRADYDRSLIPPKERGYSGAVNNINNIFKEGFTRTVSKFIPKEHKAKTLSVKAEVDIEDLYFAKNKKISFKRKESCKECSGVGAKSSKDYEICNDCYGTGKSSLIGFIVDQSCNKCKGKGKLINNPCKPCKGKGYTNDVASCSIKLHNDLDYRNDKLIVPKQGEFGGNLEVGIVIKKHKYYTVAFPDLYITLGIPFYQAILGGYAEIETLKGRATVSIPAHTQNGDILQLDGYGLKKGSSFGNLYIKIEIDIPSRVSSEKKNLLESYKKLEKGNPVKIKRNS